MSETEPIYACPICGWEYATAEEADQCAQKGVKTPQMEVGQLLYFPRGVVFRVIQLLAASHIDHEPGVKTERIAGDMSYMFAGNYDPAEIKIQIFDEETALRYIHPIRK